MKNIVSEFEPVLNAAWQKQVEKEIGREITPTWFAEGVLGNVFLGLEDKNSHSPQILAKDNPWLICQECDGNQKILEALQGGASAISLSINRNWDTQDFASTFEGVFLNFITLRVEFLNCDIQGFITNLEKYCEAQKFDFSEVKIILCGEIAPVTSGLNIKYEVKVNPSLELVPAMADVLKRAEKIGIDNVVLHVRSVPNFYLNMAQTKVLKILSAKVNLAYGLAENPAQIMNRVDVSDLGQDANIQVIAAVNQAIGAVVGGADILEIKNIIYNSPEYSEGFGERITRNIHNILMHESFLDRVGDASRGSYFMDDLCVNLLTVVWAEFSKD